MDYFKILNLGKEPFSNSPDPEFFFRSRQHTECLQNLELSIRLRRGLNVVIGDVGTGKTTLCRQLIRQFAQDDAIETHLILDPNFSTPLEFLLTIGEMFRGNHPGTDLNDWQVKEQIKKHLFEKGVEEEKTVILIIDEGQKIPDFCLEILREFLNYETNEFKLLQIVIFGQKELDQKLNEYPNFSDRINLKHRLEPMGFADTKSMIQFRLDRSSQSASGPSLFTTAALWALYRKTGGYPRKIIHLCHRCILAMIIQNRTKISHSIVHSCAGLDAIKKATNKKPIAAALACILLLLVAAGLLTDRIRLSVFEPPSVNSSPAAANPDRISKKIKLPESTEKEKPAPVKPIAMQALPNPEKQGMPVKEEKPESPFVAAKTDPVVETPVIIPAPVAPEMLGTVTLGRNETLWRLVEKVYGIFDKDRFASLRRANPKIRNPDRVERGQKIYVPAIPAEGGATAMRGYWIEIARAIDLESAVDFLRNYPENLPSAGILPYWNPKDGLQFSILLKERYDNEANAMARLETLTLAPGSSGKMVGPWGRDTVFFSHLGMN